MKWLSSCFSCTKIREPKCHRAYILSNDDIKNTFMGDIASSIMFTCDLEDDNYFIHITNFSNLSITRTPKRITLIKEDPCKINDSNNICTICTEEITEDDDIVRPNVCNHLYHRKCLQKAFEYNQSCPTCRANIGDGNHAKTDIVYSR